MYWCVRLGGQLSISSTGHLLSIYFILKILPTLDLLQSLLAWGKHKPKTASLYKLSSPQIGEELTATKAVSHPGRYRYPIFSARLAQ